jgi:hypothetical protein
MKLGKSDEANESYAKAEELEFVARNTFMVETFSDPTSQSSPNSVGIKIRGD